MTKEIYNKYSFTFESMTTNCEVLLYAKSAEQARTVAQKIEANTKRLETKYNFYNKDSFLSQINNRKLSRFKIDPETFQVLKNVRFLSKQTQGEFDITVGTLKQCTKLDSQKNIDFCLMTLKPLIGLDSWYITENFIHFSNDLVKIDLGGVIKEYAVDQAAKIAKQEDMSALINFGGDIYVNGRKPDGSEFNVAIKNPKNPQQNIAIVSLCNQGLTTSAHYERSQVVDGKQYSHIMSSLSESEQESECSKKQQDILSATVISDSVLSSGIYSTSLMLNAQLPINSKIKMLLIDQELRVFQNIIPA